MEREEGSHGYRKNPKSSSDQGAKSSNNGSDGEQFPPRFVREQEQYMPTANVIRIMRRILPQYVKISDDAKETIQKCVSEYISFITSEANESCHREQRKIITAEDVLSAMGRLGFDNYIHPLTVFLHRYREAETERNGEPSVKRTVNFGLPAAVAANYGQPFPMGNPQQQIFYEATMNEAAMDGHLRDGSSACGSNSQATIANFDPFDQFSDNNNENYIR